MDTRTKIITPEEAAVRYPEYAVVFASFDVLTAPCIRRLRSIGSRCQALIAVVGDVPGSLLPLRARAELAASLAIIDCVVMAGDSASLIAKAAVVFDEREAEARRTANLIEHVQRRNVS